MNTAVVLNNIDHKDMRVILDRNEYFGDAYMCVPTFPSEFRAIQAHYPIVFKKDHATNLVSPLALLGLTKDENLFLKDNSWDASYIPACAESKPFLIGRGANSTSADEQLLIYLDSSSPRLSKSDGEALFLEYGGNSDFLNRMSALLGAIHTGLGEVTAFTNLLDDLDLLEPFSVETSLINKVPYRLEGFYTINELKLENLDANLLQRLHQSGFLLDIYMCLASLSQIRSLIDRKNARIITRDSGESNRG